MSDINKTKLAVKESKLLPIEQMIKNAVVSLGEATPKHMSVERLIRIALTSMRMNPELYKCTPNSLMGAIFQSAFTGIEPNTEGQAYLIPFNNKRKKADGSWHTVKEVQYVLGYRGLIELFYRHGSAVSIDVHEICENDTFEFEYGTNAYLRHMPLLRGQGEVIAVYAIAKLKDNASIFQVMTMEECIEHAKKHSKCYSKKDEKFYSNTPWATDTLAMAKKTVLIQLMKLLPKSIELQRAISSDESIKTKVEKDMFAVKDDTNWQEAENGEVKEAAKADVPDPVYDDGETEWEKEDNAKTDKKTN